MVESIITSVFGKAEAEYTIKKSRFIATVQEITNEEMAQHVLEETKKRFWDARHHCYAWQIGPAGQLQKSNDDGEPAGTAGRPILEVLRKTGITNTIIIVTRYFGGIKLGASGLIRAYSHTAALGLEAAQIADYIPHRAALLTFDYTFMNMLERRLAADQIIITDREFSNAVTFHLHIPQENIENFRTAVTNLTNGTAVLELKDMVTIPIIRKT
jgi:uncharacterized YigZ family protein